MKLVRREDGLLGYRFIALKKITADRFVIFVSICWKCCFKKRNRLIYAHACALKIQLVVNDARYL